MHTTQMIILSLRILFSHLPLFLLLSFSLFCFRCNLNNFIPPLLHQPHHHYHFHSPPNSSVLLLSNFTAFSSYPILDNGVVFPHVIRNGYFSFKTHFEDTNNFTARPRRDDDDEIDMGSFVRGLGFDGPALFGFMGVGYVYTIFKFLAVYTVVYGVVFVKVIDHLLGQDRPLYRTFLDGMVLGFK